MRKACCSAVRGGNVKRAATLVESPGNRFSDAGSIPAISTRKKVFVIFDKDLFSVKFALWRVELLCGEITTFGCCEIVFGSLRADFISYCDEGAIFHKRKVRLH